MGLFDAWANYAATNATNTANTEMTAATNAANVAMNEANNAQNKALTEEQWRRDDTATQRRVADLRAAGLNPVLAAGQAAQSSAPITMSPGRVQAPTHQAPNFQDTFGGAAGSLKTGAEAYKALVEAKRIDHIKDNESKISDEGVKQAKNMTTQSEQGINMNSQLLSSRVLDANEKQWNLEFYKNNNLPTNAGNTEATKFAQMRNLVADFIRENPQTAGKEVWQAILQMIGGQRGDTK